MAIKPMKRYTRSFGMKDRYAKRFSFVDRECFVLAFRCGFTPLTQDNNYDVIYKQTANYRQTEPAG